MRASAQTPGERLRELRIASGVSARELARIAGVSGNTVLNAERGATPSPLIQRMITNALVSCLRGAEIEAEVKVARIQGDLADARAQLTAVRTRFNQAGIDKVERYTLWPAEAEVAA